MRLWRLSLATIWLLTGAFMIALLAKDRLLLVEEDRSTVIARALGPLPYDDPDLLHMVTTQFLHPPSTLPYSLGHHTLQSYKDLQLYYSFKTEQGYKFYRPILQKLFEGVKDGFFIEAGALDGEFLSNTLRLEQEAGWKGLLVEPSPNMFKQLLSKHRRAWACQSCLATHPYPHREVLVRYRWNHQIKDAFLDGFADAHSLLAGLTDGVPLDGSSGGYRSYESVQCLPLATLLLALNITRVDLVSLDVEGAEVGVLRHFPWGRVTVDVWMVEHVYQSDPHHDQNQNQDQQNQAMFSNALHQDLNQNQNQQNRTSVMNQDRNQNKTQQNTSSIDRSNDIKENTQQFIHFFTNRGYELYEVDKSVKNNFVFIRIDSAIHKKLRKL